MEARALLDALHVAERLKDETRHCYTSGGRHESVAEHSWRIALMAFWMKDEFPDVDIDKVIRMCLIHDLGECFIGDIPTFAKTDADEAREEAELMAWVRSLPEPVSGEMEALYREMIALETPGGEALQGDGQAGSHRAAQRIGHCNMGAARVSAQHDVCGRRSRVVAGLARAA